MGGRRSGRLPRRCRRIEAAAPSGLPFPPVWPSPRLRWKPQCAIRATRWCPRARGCSANPCDHHRVCRRRGHRCDRAARSCWRKTWLSSGPIGAGVSAPQWGAPAWPRGRHLPYHNNNNNNNTNMRQFTGRIFHSNYFESGSIYRWRGWTRFPGRRGQRRRWRGELRRTDSGFLRWRVRKSLGAWNSACPSWATWTVKPVRRRPTSTLPPGSSTTCPVLIRR